MITIAIAILILLIVGILDLDRRLARLEERK